MEEGKRKKERKKKKLTTTFGKRNKIIKIREQKNGSVYLEGIQEYFCSSLDELMKVFDLGIANRKVTLNSKSSPALMHSIFNY